MPLKLLTQILKIQGTELPNVNTYMDNGKNWRICTRLEGSKNIKVVRLLRDLLPHSYLFYT